MSSASLSNPCSIATIDTLKTVVTVDWDCVEKNAADFQAGKAVNGIYGPLAFVMKAIHDGTAKSKGATRE
jgi:hypothetical protein